MKKLLFSMICGLVLMMGSSAFYPALAQRGDDEDSERNPLVEDFGEDWKYVLDLFNGNPPETRSALPSVQLKLMVNVNVMELYFNKNLGEVSVALVNETGTVVSSGIFNAAAGSVSAMYIPSVNGEYTLTITGKDYQGEAFYIIRR